MILHNVPMKEILLPVYRWGKRDPERLSRFLEAAWLAWSLCGTIWLQSVALSLYFCLFYFAYLSQCCLFPSMPLPQVMWWILLETHLVYAFANANCHCLELPMPWPFPVPSLILILTFSARCFHLAPRETEAYGQITDFRLHSQAGIHAQGGSPDSKIHPLNSYTEPHARFLGTLCQRLPTNQNPCFAGRGASVLFPSRELEERAEALLHVQHAISWAEKEKAESSV